MDESGSLQAVLSYCEGLPIEVFEPGDVLLAEGPGTDRMFILIDGEVEVTRGDVAVVDIHEPGAIFGEIAAILGGDHSASVRALTPVRAYRIDRARELLRGKTEITFHVASMLARRLTDATIYLADMKRQFADRADHFGMVDEVLDALVQRQRPAVAAGSALSDDPRL